ncbi:MAG: DUF1707 SHOCT-like domain-containing protein [Longimicrobiales bacterium]
MSHGDEGARASLTHTREVTIDALMEYFANDVMDVDEFERRVDLAHAVNSTEELKELLRDLPGGGKLSMRTGGNHAPVPQREYFVTSAADVRDNSFVVAVMGGTSRQGSWRPARKNYAVAVMGGADLDFREAVLGPGVTDVQVFTMWGSIDIIVPPGVNVECSGIGIMGGFENVGQSASPVDYDAPTIRITGLALMGGVDVVIRLGGESKRDARKRRRLEKREQQKRIQGRR